MAPSAQKSKQPDRQNAISRDKNKAKRAQDENDERPSDNYETDEVQEEDEKEVEQLDSDALDDDDFPSSRKRKRVGAAEKRKSSTSADQGGKKRKKKKKQDSEDEVSDRGDDEGPGVTVVGDIVQAPKEGRVPPGQISQNTLNFLKNLAKPECNDREWFKLHEPVYRLAEKEWKDWVESFTPSLIEIDDQVPELPPRDVIHRIYRDIRFSNDKTPYKKGFSASFSRTGRKGIFAHFIPSGKSLVAAGAWQPGRNELATLRHNIQRNPSRLRNIISDPEFVKFFGEPFPHPKKERQSIFGEEDELKTAPKGIDKNHKDIDLLKLRSVAVYHHFLDSEVVAPDFVEQVCKVIKVMKPLVHCLNDMMTIPPEDDSEEAGEQPSDDD